MENKEKQGMDKQSFLDSMGLLGLPSTQLLGERMFDVMDEHNKGSVTLREYLSFMDILYHGEQNQKAMVQFKMLDQNKNKIITHEEFEQFMLSLISMAANIYGSKFDVQKKKQEIKYLFDLADLKKDGVVDIEEFQEFWKNHPEHTDFMNIITKGIKIDQNSNSNMIALKEVKDLLNEIHQCKNIIDNQICNISTQATHSNIITHAADVSNDQQVQTFGQMIKSRINQNYTEFAQKCQEEEREGPCFKVFQPPQKFGEDSFDSAHDQILEGNILDLIIEVKESKNSHQQVSRVEQDSSLELEVQSPSTINVFADNQQTEEDSFEIMFNQNQHSLELREQHAKERSRIT